MSEATPELPHGLLNTWAGFRWRFGAGLWCCSALTVTEMGTHILQVLSLGKRKKGGGHSTEVTHRRVAVHSSRHTGDQHTSHTQPTSVSWREETYQRSIPTSCTWSPCSSWRDAVWGGNRENIKQTHPFGCAKTHEWLPVQRSVGLCALVVQEEKRTETQVMRILIFGIVAVEVLVALFLVLLKKLHRHKLKTIFNFKMT